MNLTIIIIILGIWGSIILIGGVMSNFEKTKLENIIKYNEYFEYEDESEEEDND